MYTLFLLLWVLVVFIAMPVLFVMLIVNLIRKKQKWKILVSFAVCFNVSVVCVFGAMFTVPEDMQKEMPTTTVETTTEKPMVTTTEKAIAPPTTEKQTTPPTTTKKATPPTTVAPATTKPITPKVDAMVKEFVKLGFTQAEAKEMRKIFATVGITEISNVQAVGNAGIDNLQAFKCDIYDYHRDKGGVSVVFTVEKRRLCHISLNGFYNTVLMEYDNVVLYDIWNEDGTINEDAVGYKAVFDYENKKITNYEE